MKKLLGLLLAVALIQGCHRSERHAAAETGEPGMHTAGGQRVAQVAEAGCAMCIFGMPDAACELAVKIDGKVYLVKGSSLDDHGDAHAPDGMCIKARSAYVEGRIDGDKFVAEKFELRR